MAGGTGQKYDVFVSYAHADNEIPESSSAKFGWVTTLARNLNIAPNVYPKNLFIDHRLKPGDVFSDDLVQIVQNSALLVLLLSQNYIDSNWCGKELDHFIRTRGRLRRPDAGGVRSRYRGRSQAQPSIRPAAVAHRRTQRQRLWRATAADPVRARCRGKAADHAMVRATAAPGTDPRSRSRPVVRDGVLARNESRCFQERGARPAACAEGQAGEGKDGGGSDRSVPDMMPARKLVFIDDLASQPALSEKLRAIVRGANCDIRSLPPGAPLGEQRHRRSRKLLKPCRAGITVYADRDQVRHRLQSAPVFSESDRRGAVSPLVRWGVYLERGTVATEFGIESDEVVPINEQKAWSTSCAALQPR